MGQVIAHSATSLVLTLTDLWPEEGIIETEPFCPGAGKLQGGPTAFIKFLFFEDSIILRGALGRMTATLIFSNYKESEFSIMVFKLLP